MGWPRVTGEGAAPSRGQPGWCGARRARARSNGMIAAPLGWGSGPAAGAVAGGSGTDASVAAQLCAGGHDGAPEEQSGHPGLSQGATSARHRPR
jgi:hypothetical protein